MTMSISRKLLIPALLAVAIAPMSLTALAGQHGEGHKHHGASHSHHQEKRDALYERAGIDEETREALKQAQEDHHQALEELHREHRERMDELLDDEQREALKEARRDMRKEWREERHAAMQERFESIVDSWDLSEEDREALRETREALYTDMQAMRDKEFDTREERREAWKAIRDSHHEALSELLTDEQIAELKQAARPKDGKGHGYRGHSMPHGSDHEKRAEHEMHHDDGDRGDND